MGPLHCNGAIAAGVDCVRSTDVPLGLPAIQGQATAQIEIWYSGLFLVVGSQHIGEMGAREIPAPATEQCQLHQVAHSLSSCILGI